MQYDVTGHFKFFALMIAGAVHEQQDELPGILLGHCLQKNLEALGIGRRHDQIDASSVLWTDGAIQIDVFANELAGDLWPCPIGSPAWSRAVHPPEARLVGEHDAQAAATSGGNSPGSPHGGWEALFFKASLAARSRLGLNGRGLRLRQACPF